MKSRLPKVLHRVCGRELIRYPVDLLGQLGIRRVVVVVSPANGGAIQELLGDQAEYVTQPQVSGTGDAVSRAAGLLMDQAEHLLVLNGDVPLLGLDSTQLMMSRHLKEAWDMTMLTAAGVVSQDLGRVLRDGQGRVVDVVEASNWQGPSDGPAEVNGGVYCFNLAWLRDNLSRIEPSPQGEKYLTSLVGLGKAGDAKIQGVNCAESSELLGVNNRLQLSQAEAVQRQRILEGWMLAGVTIQDPSSVYIDADVNIGQDTCVYPNTAILGRTIIGEDCHVGPNSVIQESTVGDRCRITASMLEEATMEHDVAVGPFSHLRPGTTWKRVYTWATMSR